MNKTPLRGTKKKSEKGAGLSSPIKKDAKPYPFINGKRKLGQEMNKHQWEKVRKNRPNLENHQVVILIAG